MDNSDRIVVLYASQTYTAKELAERIWRNTKLLGLKGPVLALDDYPISKLIHESFAIFVCATTGQGDEPDNMRKFWKFLLRKSLPSNSLVKLKYGVLGLGDSSYAKFNFVGKKLHKRLLQLGATPLLEIGLCDYQHDLGHDAVMIPWLKNYFSILQKDLPSVKPDILSTYFVPRWKVSIYRNEDNYLSSDLGKDIYFAKGFQDNFVHSLLFEVEQNNRTTSKEHFQDVRLITLRTTNGQTLDYKPGDIYNIRPRNSKEDIDDLFSIFEENNIDIKPQYKLIVEECHSPGG